MPVLCKPLLALLLLLLHAQIHAKITVAFYSHEFGSSFPHAFFTISGTPETGGTPVDTNFGFTAKSVTPAILMGSVVGVVEQVKPKYIASSNRQFALEVSDAQYAALMAVVAKWRAIPGKSYNLNARNCIHFVGEAAQAVGLNVVFEKKLLKRPRSFLESIVRLNPALKELPR